MPSMHVAMAVLNALFLGRLAWWLGALRLAFAAAILFGSVYFGWHYDARRLTSRWSARWRSACWPDAGRGVDAPVAAEAQAAS